MSNYTQNVFFGPKDALSSGDPDKIARGTEIDAELDEISTAIESKEDTANKGQANGYAGLDAGGLVAVADLPTSTESAAGIVEMATTAEVVTGTDTARAVTPAGVEAWAAQNGGMVQDISNMTDPGADTLIGWDDSATAAIQFTLGAGILHSGTELSIDHDAATNFVSAEHVNHSSVSVVAGAGMTGGGTIDGSVTLDVVATANQGLTVGANSVGIDASALTNVAGHDLVATDEFLVSDGGVIKTIAYSDSGVPVPAINSGTSDTFDSNDINKVLRYSSTSTVTLTINSSVGLPGNWIMIIKTGASGTINFAGTATIISNAGSTSLSTQYGVVVALCLDDAGADTWILYGDLD